MDNGNSQHSDMNIVEEKREVNEAKKAGSNSAANSQCCPTGPACKNGCIDSSLLFFFLILVCIINQSDCGICTDTLLWFFLLLVVLMNKF